MITANLHRRRVLLSICIGGTTLLAGCNDGNASSMESQMSSPDSAVEGYLQAVNNGNDEQAMQFVYPDGNFSTRAEDQIEAGSPIEIQSIETEILQQDSGKALVIAESTINREGIKNTQVMYLELRIADNSEWKIYQETPIQEIDPELLPDEDLTLEQRVQDVSPRDSFEVYVGGSRDTAELFFIASDVAEVQNLEERDGVAYVRLDFPEVHAEQMQETILNVNSDLINIDLFQYLGDEEIGPTQLSHGLADRIKNKRWVDNPEVSLVYEDLERAKVVVATILDVKN